MDSREGRAGHPIITLRPLKESVVTHRHQSKAVGIGIYLLPGLPRLRHQRCGNTLPGLGKESFASRQGLRVSQAAAKLELG